MACVQTFFTHESKEIEVPFKNDWCHTVICELAFQKWI
jgi:hypothetical protein